MYFIIYHSKASEKITESDLNDILETSRRNNPKNDITGCLLYYNGEFLQILEGEKEAVTEQFEKIRKDSRNREITLLESSSAEKRMYPDWSMAYYKMNDNEMDEVREYLKIEDFDEMHKIKSAPSLTHLLFYYVGQHMISKKE